MLCNRGLAWAKLAEGVENALTRRQRAWADRAQAAKSAGKVDPHTMSPDARRRMVVRNRDDRAHANEYWRRCLADAERCIAAHPHFVKGHRNRVRALARLRRTGTCLKLLMPPGQVRQTQVCWGYFF